MNIKTLLFGEKVTVKFTSLLPLEECVKRLKNSVATPHGWTQWDWIGDIAGDIDNHRFKLWRIIRPYGLQLRAGNVWNPFYYGSMTESSTGTLIIGYFAVPVPVKLYFIVFDGLVVLLLILFILSQIWFDVFFDLRSNASFVGVGILMLFILLAWARYGILKGRKEYLPIIGFIRTTLEAIPNPDDLKNIPV
jgi:hypothetical protein